jgi:hypothetical protein
MSRIMKIATSLLVASASAPALAHFTGSSTPHWQASDAWGLLAVAVLTGVAAWLDRRSR